MPGGDYEAYTDNGREPTGVDAVEWASRAAELGAGELLVTSIDRDGTGRGFDTGLAQYASFSAWLVAVAINAYGTILNIIAALGFFRINEDKRRVK